MAAPSISCNSLVRVLATLERPEKWDDSQVGFQGSNASGGRIVLLPGAFWAHDASKMAILGASLLLNILQCFRASEGMLLPGACRMSRASARRIVSCKGRWVSSPCPQIPHAPAPTFGGFRRGLQDQQTQTTSRLMFEGFYGQRAHIARVTRMLIRSFQTSTISLDLLRVFDGYLAHHHWIL